MAREKIFVAGHQGMVGSALCRALQRRNAGQFEIVVVDRSAVDLCNQKAVYEFFERERPDTVFLAAAKVGGILANQSYPADFIYQNLGIQLNVIHSAANTGTKRLLFLGSSCIYPKYAETPIREEQLLTGELESTNLPYAIAKIAGIKICASYNLQYAHLDYRSIMPCNLYGPGDNYDPENSHVLPALIRRFHEAKNSDCAEVIVWGTGVPRREFLHVDDFAEACLCMMDVGREEFRQIVGVDLGFMNAGAGIEVSIFELANIVADVVGFDGSIRFDSSKPDGVFSKLIDSSRIGKLGWQPKISLRDGIQAVYRDYLDPRMHKRSSGGSV
jgi:GDP-L-fucose synthase